MNIENHRNQSFAPCTKFIIISKYHQKKKKLVSSLKYLLFNAK